RGQRHFASSPVYSVIERIHISQEIPVPHSGSTLTRLTICLLAITFTGCTANVAPPAAESPDLILYHGKIVTVDKTFSIAEAIAVRDGKITAVGTDADLLAAKGSGTKLIDLAGKTVIP